MTNRKIGQWNFDFLGIIKPDMDGGKVTHYDFRDRALNQNNSHAYWDMDFCRFTYPFNIPAQSGVYAFYAGDDLKYVGSALNLSQRVNEYRKITLGQIKRPSGIATNCHVNGEIYKALNSGKEVAVYIHVTDDYKAVERRLRWEYKPEWNRQL